MDAQQVAFLALIVACVALAAMVGVRLAARFGLPGLLLFLGLGLLLGEQGIGGIPFDDAELATSLGYLALVVILAEGGLTTRPANIRPVIFPAAVLGLLGVALSIALVALPTHFILGLDLRTSMLLGAALAPTDAAAVFTVARGLRLPARLQGLLEAESGLNDAPVVVVIVMLSSTSLPYPAWVAPLVILAELLGGVLLGIGVGMLGRWLLPRLALPAAGLYPVAVLAIVLLSYGLAAVVEASGFAAVYLTSVLLAGSDLPHRRAVLGFVEGLAWAVQLGLFVMLGLLAMPSRLPAAIPTAMVVGVLLLAVARPLSTLACLWPFRADSGGNRLNRITGTEPIPRRWIALVSWAGLRGAVPIIFAAIPLGAHVPQGTLIFDATLLLVIVLTLVQSPTIPWAARRLGLATPEKVTEISVDVAPLDDMRAALMDLSVPSGSGLVGAYVAELPLPRDAVVSLVIRAGQSIVPDRYTRLRAGDRLLVVTTEAARPGAEAVFAAVARSGRLADWIPPRPPTRT